MAANQYMGVGGVARKVKGQNFGIAGVARKVTNGYVGIGGVARKFYAGLDIKPTLADNDWATIAAVSALGTASTYWGVGDEKNITLTTGETLTLVIMGFDHDDLAGGGKAGITFGMKHLMTDTRQMNGSSTNRGGFTGSDMYTWLQNDLFSQLPPDLQTVIKSVNKKTSAGGANSTINIDTMKLFLYSEVEVFGSAPYSYAGEGSQYSYFTMAANRVKKLKNGTGYEMWWFVRSPRAGYTNMYCMVSDGGKSSGTGATSNGGVSIGLCV